MLSKFFFGMLIILMSIILSNNTFAHPDDDKVSIQSLLYKWANAMQLGDKVAMEEVLSTDFKLSAGYSRSEYIASLKKLDYEFLFSHAEHNKAGEDYIVSSILAKPYDMELYIDYAVSFKGEAGEWKINSWTLTTDIPPDLARKLEPRPLPEQFATLPVKFSLYDADQKAPVYARVHIADEKGEYWPPQGHQKYIATGFRKDVGGDVQLGSKVFAYVKPNFIAELPEGKYYIQVAKGMEYTPQTFSFTVKSGQENAIDVSIKRWIDMQAQGWYAGDTHTHFLSDHNALLEAEGEDLNIVSILATKWGEIITDVTHVTGEASPVSKPDRIVFYNEETRHNFLGHTILHPIKEPIYPLTWGGAYEGVANGSDYPTMAHQADKAHKQGGMVTWAHLGDPTKGELAVDVALGKIDSLDVFTWRNAFNRSHALEHRGVDEPSPVNWWYHLLNTGARLSASAGTDKMFNEQVTGSVRTYAYLENEKLTYRAWAEAIRQGRTFITTGPMLSFTANGQGIGSAVTLKEGDEIELNAEVYAPHDRFFWDRFEIVHNGEVIASHKNAKGKDRVKLTIRVKPTSSSWFAARVYDTKDEVLAESGRLKNPSMAHTSPIYVDIPGSKIWSKESADFLKAECDKAIAWAKNKARYHTNLQREEVIALFEKARAVYDEK